MASLFNDIFKSLGNTLSDLPADIGRGAYALSTFGASEYARAEEQKKLAALNNILSGQNVPESARLDLSPEQIQQNQLTALSQVSPEFMQQRLAALIPKKADPVVSQDAFGNPVIIDKATGQGSRPTGLPTYEGIQPAPAQPMGQPQPTMQRAHAAAQSPVDKLAQLTAQRDYYVAKATGAPPKVADTARPIIDNLNKEIEYLRGQSKDTSKVGVPGYKLTGEIMPSGDDAKTVKTVVTAKKQLDKLVSEYEALVDKYGTESDIPVPIPFMNASIQNPLNQEGQRLFRQKQAQITLIAKNLEELGALQAPDRQILNDMFADATDVKFATTPGSAKIVKKQIKDYKSYLNDRLDSAITSRGYESKLTGADGKQQAADKSSPTLTRDQAIAELKRRGKL